MVLEIILSSHLVMLIGGDDQEKLSDAKEGTFGSIRKIKLASRINRMTTLQPTILECTWGGSAQLWQCAVVAVRV